MPQATQFFRSRLLARHNASLALCVALFIVPNGARAQSSASVDATKIIIGEGTLGTAHVPLYVAEQEGFFKSAGLDVTSESISGGTPSVMAAFASGAVNILNLSGPELVEYTGSKVISGKAFGEIYDQSYDIVVSKGITSIQDMKGKTIGISGPNSGDWIYFLGLMEHYGIAAGDVTFITVGSPLNRLAALSSGAIQVTTATNNLRDQSLKAGSIVLKSADSPVQFPGNLLIANNDLLANHKPLLRKFVAAMSQATAWIKANPAAANADCAKGFNATVEACALLIPLNFDKTISSPYTWSSTYAINVDGIKSSLAAMATIQPDTQKLTLDDLIDTSIAGTSP